MIIVVNTQLLLKNKLEGLGWFTYEILKRITINNPEHTFYFVFDRAYNQNFIFAPNVKPVILHPPSRHPLLWFLRFEILLPVLLKKLKADIYLSPDGWSTLHTKIPCLQVIHDLNFEHHPEDIPYLITSYFRYFFPRYARKAKHLFTVSEYSKQDIVNTYKIPAEKIDVVYNGCNSIYAPLDEKTNELTRNTYTNGKPYFLYIGALIPRKNICRLFKAYDIFRASDTKNIKLLIVGEHKWGAKEMERTYNEMKYKEDVVFLGRLHTECLHKVMAAALCLTFIPYFEGFGIPIIEAFSCGVPVITSHCTSMPEVAGDAALLVNPYDIEEIARAMQTISTDEELRQNFIAKGLERKKIFSWDLSAEKMWRRIQMIADNLKQE